MTFLNEFIIHCWAFYFLDRRDVQLNICMIIFCTYKWREATLSQRLLWSEQDSAYPVSYSANSKGMSWKFSAGNINLVSFIETLEVKKKTLTVKTFEKKQIWQLLWVPWKSLQMQLLPTNSLQTNLNIFKWFSKCMTTVLTGLILFAIW